MTQGKTERPLWEVEVPVASGGSTKIIVEAEDYAEVKEVVEEKLQTIIMNSVFLGRVCI